MGFVIFVVNYFYGLVDGMIFVDLIGCCCDDFCILICLILIGIDEFVVSYMIFVLFFYEEDVQWKMLEMWNVVMEYLVKDGLIVLFLFGVVVVFEIVFGLVVEVEWNVFIVKMICKFGVMVVFCYFLGLNLCWYQIVNFILLILC